MIYAKNLKVGDTIGVTAVSDGVGDELDQVRFKNGKKKLETLGYKVEFTPDVFTVEKQGRSAKAKVRAEEFNSLLKDNVRVISSAKGGNFLNEMMEYVDFEKFFKDPKWFHGFSDNTWLTHTITTKYDIASIYGSNFGDFGMDCWHESVNNHLEILKGNYVEQNSFDMYQEGWGSRVTGLEGYELNQKVRWKIDENTLKKQDSVSFSGRLIGGCLDVLLYMQGTKYDGTEKFLEKYKEDGFIYYLESFETSAENLMMFMWKLKEIGWFKYTKGIIMGRPLFYQESMDVSYQEAVMYALADLNIPVVFDCDFGHVGPRFSMINGAKANVEVKNGKGKLRYFIKN